MQRVAGFVPAVEIADDGDALGVGGPDAEKRAGRPLRLAETGAELVVKAAVAAFVEEVEVVVREPQISDAHGSPKVRRRRTISGTLPTRTAGPQVPAPEDT